MTARVWRGALVGCGFFASNHLHAWASIAKVSIVALCDLDRAKACALGKQFNINRIYEDASALLDNEEIDFLDIVTTVSSHRPLVELGADQGKAIVCQKPLAQTLEDADAMVAACRAAGVPLLVHENFRWQHPFVEIARQVREGAIGQAQSLRLTFRHDYADKYRNQPYLANAERLALMDVGVHLFDLARVLLGEIDSLHCRTQRLNPVVRGEDSFLVTCRHTSGAVSLMDCSFFARAEADLFPQTLALIEGTRGKLQLLPGYQLAQYNGGQSGEAGLHTTNVEPPVPSWGAKPWHIIQDSVLNFQRHVIEVFEGREKAQPSGADNRETLARVFAAYESARRDEVIKL